MPKKMLHFWLTYRDAGRLICSGRERETILDEMTTLPRARSRAKKARQKCGLVRSGCDAASRWRRARFIGVLTAMQRGLSHNCPPTRARMAAGVKLDRHNDSGETRGTAVYV
jgi:hypothetical protein